MSYSPKATSLVSESMENVFERKEEAKRAGKDRDVTVGWRAKLPRGNQGGVGERVLRTSMCTCDVFALPKGPPLSSNPNPVVRGTRRGFDVQTLRK